MKRLVAKILMAGFAFAAPFQAHAGFEEGRAAYHAKDYVTATRELTPAAEQGNTEAMVLLALTHAAGKGKDDNKKALFWYHKAAELGHPLAQTNLGVRYVNGVGGEKVNIEQGVLWLQRAVQQNFPAAQYFLGMMYLGGRDVPRDDALALKLMTQAAEGGLVIAQYILGTIYLGGVLTEPDRDKALFWLKKAADKGNVKARELLKTFEPDDKK